MSRAWMVAVLFIWPWPLQAQSQLLELQPGVRVRVSAPVLLGGRYDATVGARRGDTLALVRAGSPTLDIPISAVTGVEIFRGESRIDGARRGALLGGAIGLGLGALVVLGPNKYNCEYEVCDPKDALSDTEFAAFIGLGGVLWGAGIGALVGRDRWQRLNVPGARLSLSLHQSSRAARLGVRLSF
jgi:hypothetical protein